jgi:hypothetical protein
MTKAGFYGLTVPGVLVWLLLLTTVAGAQQLVGKGEWQSLSSEGIAGTWSVRLRRADTQVSGTMEIRGSNVLKSASVSGTVDGRNVMLGLGSNGVTAATFSGQLSGTSISGEWECPAVKDQGVWHGTLSAQN